MPSTRPIVMVSFQLDVEAEAPFSAFYHHRYIPNLMDDLPEIRSAWRYQEHHVAGSLKYYRKQFITIYACDSQEGGSRVIAALDGRPGREADQAEWAKWRALAMHDPEPPCLYLERWRHPRMPADGIFGSRPFFMVSVEVAAERQAQFDEWYEQQYLPRNVADVPSWAGCRRYSSVGRTPARHHAVYEAGDLMALDASLEAMRAPFRLEESMSWKQWDTGDRPAITWEDAAAYKPIFRKP
jgi:hypothetical protein